MAQSDFLKAYKAQKAQTTAPQSPQRTDSSRSASPPPPEDVGVEVEEEVEPGFTDFTVAESVGQVPDPVALQQSRQAVAQKVLPQTSSDRMFGSAGQLGRQQLLQDIKKGVGLIGKGIDATTEFYNNLGRDQLAELPSEYVDRQVEMLEAQKARLQQQIDDLRGEAARRTGVQEDRLRFQGMEP